MSSKGRIVRCLVVGGARRLGAAVAVELAASGADVAVSSRSPVSAAGVLARIEKLGRRGAAVGGDVTARLEARHLVRTAAGALGGLDLVVFAASGPFDPTPPELVDEDAWSRSVDVIARGFLFCAQAAREVFLEGSGAGLVAAAATDDPVAAMHCGTVVALTDVTDEAPWPRLTPHYAAKAAEVMLVRLLGAAWASDGVRVSGVAPGPVDLPDDDHREASERAMRRMGYPRLLTPAEIAAAVLACTKDPALSGQNRLVRVE
jgi:NAD(P)-dependent dehydrogenase (short-subunit alcohol dehydrogenase family)